MTNRANWNQNRHVTRAVVGRDHWFWIACLLPLTLLIASSAFGHPGVLSSSVPTMAFEPIPSEESDATLQRLNTIIEHSLSRAEHRLLDDARDGQFDHHTLLDAALIASGVTDLARRGRYQQQFDTWVETIAAELENLSDRKSDDQIVARWIFEYIHRQILTGGYALHSTNLSDAFDTGRFNCVSATLLFCCLAEQFDLDVRGLETVGHAMSCLIVANERIEIESTCPRWFHLASDPKRRAELIEKTIGVRPNHDAKNYRLVSEVELIATIYYNRGLDLLAEGNFTGALAANATAIALDPSNKTAHGNLLAVLNNWAISLAGSGEYLKAIGLLEAGIRVDPDFTTFYANILHVHRRWVENLCGELRYGEAIHVLAEGSRRWPNEPWFRARCERLMQRVGGE